MEPNQGSGMAAKIQPVGKSGVADFINSAKDIPTERLQEPTEPLVCQDGTK